MKKIHRLFALLLVLLTLCSAVSIPAFAVASTGFDALSDSAYAKTFTLSASGKTIPYTAPNLKDRGTYTYGASSSSYIDNSADELYLMDVGCDNGIWWAKVSYPTSSRRVVAFIPLSAITENNAGHEKTVSTGKFYCGIRAGSSNSSSYYVAKGDTVYLISTSGSRYQILYPTSGGKWRLAWCNKSDYQKYCGNTGSSGDTAGMIDVTAYLAGKTIILRSVQNGKYLCADRNISNTPAMCNRDSTTTWTSFTVSAITSDGWVGLKASSNGKYLSATANVTDAPVRAAASKLQSWECFRIYLKGNDFYLKAQVNGKWLCVRVDKSGAPLEAYANGASTWERFTILFDGQTQYISAAELINTAVSGGIGANSNAYRAMDKINSTYAGQLSRADRSGTMVFMFEGVGNDASASKRLNAMCVVVKNGDIIYLSRNCSTIPDAPFDPSRNGGTDMPTLKSGIYSFKTVNHQRKYAALNVCGDEVLRFQNQNSYYSSTSGQINVHRRSQNYLYSSGTPNSAGCLLVGAAGTGSSDEYARFIQALGIVSGNARGDAKYTGTVSGKIVVDRSYAYSYLISVGYPEGAIGLIG